MMEIVIYGLILGFGAAAMPGPINVEVLRRAVSRGPVFGALFGMGAVTADVFYVTGTSYRVTQFFDALPEWGKALMTLAGAALLTFLGIRALRYKVPPEMALAEAVADVDEPENYLSRHAPRLARNYVLGLSLTLFSPSTFAYWLFISLGLVQHYGNVKNVVLPLAVGVGIACTTWVVFSTTLVGYFHKRISPRMYVVVERVAGVALLFFAAAALFKAVERLLQHYG